jgi:hypothetical protein
MRTSMKSDILYPGAFPMARVQLAEGEGLKAESGAMVSASPTLARLPDGNGRMRVDRGGTAPSREMTA